MRVRFVALLARPVLGLAVVVAATLPALSACGNGGPSQREITQDRGRLGRILSAEVTRIEKTKAHQRESACRSQVGRALALLDKQPQILGKDPSILASLDTYSVRVAEIDTEIGRVPRGSLDSRCLLTLRALTAAAAIHKEVVREWSDCAAEHLFCESTISFCAGDIKPIGMTIKERRTWCEWGKVPATPVL
jgi:hypothetical protein